MALQRTFWVALFFLTTVVLAFGLYPLTAWAVHSINDGVSGLHADGSPNTYTRLVPAGYEPTAIGALDLGMSIVAVCGLFYGASLVRRQNDGLSELKENAKKPSKSAGKDKTTSGQANHRLWLIPIWFVAQYIWNFLSGMSAGQALDMMTSLNSLWISAVVITVIVLYAKNYQVVFGRDEERQKNSSAPKK